MHYENFCGISTGQTPSKEIIPYFVLLKMSGLGSYAWILQWINKINVRCISRLQGVVVGTKHRYKRYILFFFYFEFLVEIICSLVFRVFRKIRLFFCSVIPGFHAGLPGIVFSSTFTSKICAFDENFQCKDFKQ